MKTCSKCKVSKDFILFKRNSSRPDGFDYQCKECVKEYRKENKHLSQKYDATYYSLNKSKFSAKVAYRRALLIKATPVWLSEEHKKDIQDFYWLAKDLKSVSGEDYHVDHIEPLQGKDICGLHVPWNLQVILAKDNLAKSNKRGAS